ncbi:MULTISPECIES: acyl-CoA reductase [unclassified Sedimentibacter]|uniref:acyl-CoA reductase n=1 Tax=unclassified Sedimentibacter TaxID=2649220 RepID=UPI0027E09B3E|nr:acyl-CoA reductase [Sedimentibacter sp. MB35-C1]WMJ77710.1 acyl-CoA reductase [Sedimentibacter sp. MB35-C1]
MNLVNGKFIDSKECDIVLDNLEQHIIDTLNKERLSTETVVNACDKLVTDLDEEFYIKAMSNLGIDESLGRSYIDEMRRFFCKESLLHRMKLELGDTLGSPYSFNPMHKEFTVTRQILPLGVLLHVAAGNADGLPAFSVLEGLLTGNINILKLPAAEGGISAHLLFELIKAEPALADYIYVFDYSSKDIEHIEKLISVADAVVVWGGREAVSALRRLIPPNTKLIEWGHKVSFAYVTKQGMAQNKLEGLAKNIAETGQLLCSSAQGIFLDTDDMNDIYEFCDRFLPVLDYAINKNAKKIGIGIKSQVALRLYAEELEGIYKDSRIFKGDSCSLIAYPDKIIDTSIQFGNPWVRPLPHIELLSALRPYKNYLQTVGLACDQSELHPLSHILFKTGVVRVCPCENMSHTYCGAPHDGEFPLRRYTKIVDIDTD